MSNDPNADLKKDLSTAVRRARVELKYTQEEMADHLGINSHYYGRIERGRSLPSMKLLRQIAQRLGVSADRLLGIDKSDVDNVIEPQRAPKIEHSPLLRRIIRRSRCWPTDMQEVLEEVMKLMEKLRKIDGVFVTKEQLAAVILKGLRQSEGGDESAAEPAQSATDGTEATDADAD